MKKILELDLRMAGGDHNIIDLKDQQVFRQYSSKSFESCEEVLEFITHHRTDDCIDVTGTFSKSHPREKKQPWESETYEEIEYDHDGFSRIFCNQVAYIMIVYANEDD